MNRSLFHLFGAGLVAVFIAGIITIGVSAWLAWLDLGFGLISIFAAASLVARERRGAVQVGGVGLSSLAILLCLGLFVAWIVAEAIAGVVGWLGWTTLVFAGLYLLLSAAIPHERTPRVEKQQRPPERPRRAA